mgnify:CR=1 FL=1
MNSTRTVAVRLDNQVAQEYERLAQLKGDKLGTYLRDLLTSNLQIHKPHFLRNILIESAI